MRKILFLAICGLLGLNSAFAAETFYGPTSLNQKVIDSKVEIYGPANLRQVKLDGLTVYGPLDFSDLEIDGKTEVTGIVNNAHNGKFDGLKIHGPFSGDHILAEDLYVVGPVQLEYIKVTDETEVVGPLSVNNGFFNNLKLTSRLVKLENVTVKNISFKNAGDKEQVLFLSGKTIVNGDIDFGSKKGVVFLGPDVQFKGEIKGGIKKPLDFKIP